MLSFLPGVLNAESRHAKQPSFQVQKWHQRKLAFNNFKIHLACSVSAKSRFVWKEAWAWSLAMVIFHTCRLWDLRCLLERPLIQSQTVKRGKTSVFSNCGQVTYTKSAQDQASQTSIVGGGGAPEASPSAEELLAISGSLWAWWVACCPCPSGCPHICVHRGSTN